jgi:hypothetical protein
MAKQRKSYRKRFSSLDGAGFRHFANAQCERRAGLAEVRRAHWRVCGGFHDHVTPLAEQLGSWVETVANPQGRTDTEHLGGKRQRQPKSVVSLSGR